jgi:hypothetical protein
MGGGAGPCGQYDNSLSGDRIIARAGYDSYRKGESSQWLGRSAQKEHLKIGKGFISRTWLVGLPFCRWCY